MKVLITGAAGFVGSHLHARLQVQGHDVVGVDRFSDYYPVALKRWRYQTLVGEARELISHDLAVWPFPKPLMGTFDAVVHLAAQPGVRLGFGGTQAYVGDNVAAFFNVCRLVQEQTPGRFFYASSSSVYGDRATPPFSESEDRLYPVSLYGATKLTKEHAAAVLKRTDGIDAVGLRFFSVYGPWGRPDMAYWRFARALRKGEPFSVYGDGTVERDFTYVEDVVASIGELLTVDQKRPLPALLNIGGSAPRSINDLMSITEALFGMSLDREFLPANKEDARVTMADTELLVSLLGQKPETPLEVGLAVFVEWYRKTANKYGVLWDELNL